MPVTRDYIGSRPVQRLDRMVQIDVGDDDHDHLIDPDDLVRVAMARQ